MKASPLLQLDAATLVALGRCELFGHVPEADLQGLAAGAQTVDFAADELLLETGLLNGRVYVVIEGQVETLRDGPRGGARGAEVIARLGPGSCHGEVSALTGRPVGQTVRAAVPTRVVAFAKETLLAGLEKFPRLGANLAQLMMERVEGHLGRRIARTVLVLLDPSSAADLAAARALLLRVAHYAPRTVVADLSDRLGLIRARGLPSLDELSRNPGRSAAILHDLASGRDLFWTVRPGAAPPEARRLFGLLGVFDAYCDQLVLVADAGRAAELLEHGADYLERVVWCTPDPDASILAQRPLRSRPPLADAAHRLLVRELPLPLSVGAARELDRRRGGKCFASDGPVADPRSLDALARDITGQRLGLALGAGAARGFAHIGVLERLIERGVPVDAIAGSSAGAGIGCMWSMGFSAERMLATFAQLEKHAVRWTLPLRSILSGASLERYMRTAIAGQGFDDARQPFGIVAVDLYAAREELFTDGDIVRCVLASSAIPGVYPPVRLGPRWYVDGAVLNPLPTAFVRPLGADRVIAIDLAAAAAQAEALPARGPHLLDVLRHSARLMHARITEHNRLGADLILRPDLGLGKAPGFRDYDKAREWHRFGREVVDHAWPEIVALLPWLEPRSRAGRELTTDGGPRAPR